MTELSLEVSGQLERVVDGLVAHTAGEIHRHDLRAVVLDCYAQLAAHATITTFLPILTGGTIMLIGAFYGGMETAAIAMALTVIGRSKRLRSSANLAKLTA